jgi:hypothetical protein
MDLAISLSVSNSTAAPHLVDICARFKAKYNSFQSELDSYYHYDHEGSEHPPRIINLHSINKPITPNEIYWKGGEHHPLVEALVRKYAIPGTNIDREFHASYRYMAWLCQKLDSGNHPGRLMYDVA